MSIKYVSDHCNERELRFGILDQGDFFIDVPGNYCQKINETTAVMIAHPNGAPYGGIYRELSYRTPIKAICKQVVTISFEIDYDLSFKNPDRKADDE